MRGNIFGIYCVYIYIYVSTSKTPHAHSYVMQNHSCHILPSNIPRNSYQEKPSFVNMWKVTSPIFCLAAMTLKRRAYTSQPQGWPSIFPTTKMVRAQKNAGKIPPATNLPEATYLAGLPLSGQWCSTMAFLAPWRGSCYRKRHRWLVGKADYCGK